MRFQIGLSSCLFLGCAFSNLASAADSLPATPAEVRAWLSTVEGTHTMKGADKKKGDCGGSVTIESLADGHVSYADENYNATVKIPILNGDKFDNGGGDTMKTKRIQPPYATIAIVSPTVSRLTYVYDFDFDNYISTTALVLEKNDKNELLVSQGNSHQWPYLQWLSYRLTNGPHYSPKRNIPWTCVSSDAPAPKPDPVP
jgi:hypothetical protein